MNNFWQRTLTGFFFISFLIIGVLWNSIFFFGLFLVVEILALREFYIIAKKSKSSPQKYFGSIVGALAFVFVFIESSFDCDFHLSLLLIPLVFFIFITELYRNKEQPILNIATTLLGLMYVSLPLVLLNNIVFLDGNFNGNILLGVFILIWSSDTGAYIFGISFGKHRLFERISPKKSWEGFVGGVIVSQIIAFMLSHYLGGLGYIHWVILAVIVAIFGTLGDLVESLFKRSVGIKDSSNILPGHGGILDRFDSLFFAVPMIFVYLHIISHYNL